MQPGETINPRDNSDSRPEDNANPSKNVDPMQESNISNNPLAENSDQADPANPWQYNQDSGTEADQNASVSIDPVSWTASEFIDHEKNSSWFMSLAVLTVVAVAVIYLVTRDYVTSVVIIISAILFAVMAKRRPRTLKYQIDNVGVIINEKYFPYELFKSFTIMAEGAFSSIQLIPLKRFMPPISLYFPPESETQIVATLGSYLPHENRNNDLIDSLMRKIRF